MLESVRKPLDRQCLFLGRVISSMTALGTISVNVYERKIRKLPRQIVMQVRLRMLPNNELSSNMDKIKNELSSTCPLISYQLFVEDKFVYADFKFIVC